MTDLQRSLTVSLYVSFGGRVASWLTCVAAYLVHVTILCPEESTTAHCSVHMVKIVALAPPLQSSLYRCQCIATRLCTLQQTHFTASVALRILVRT